MWSREIDHNNDALAPNVTEQLDLRLQNIQTYLESDLKLDAIAARGGPLKPVKNGTYKINTKMLSDYRSAKYANHASNLGALMAAELQKTFAVPAYIVDPVTIDNFIDIARISGVKGIERKSRSHALNINYCVRKCANELSVDFNNSNFIVAHLGSGFSIAAVQNGVIIDVNDALLGMGPFSIERAGGLPISGLLDLVYNGDQKRKEIEHVLSKESGLFGYLGTNDFIEIEKMIDDGNKNAEQVVDAMVYQIVKEIGGLYASLSSEISALIFTGGLANSEILINKLKRYLNFINNIVIYPGSFELQALTEGVLRILNGEEKVNTYK